MKKTLLIILGTLSSIFIVGALSFYLLVAVGLSPILQDTWVCAAMTSFSHKYLATAFISEERINEILDSHKIDDSENSEIKEFETKEKNTGASEGSEKETEETDEYIAEGYEFLEEGIYLKKISGKNHVGTAYKGYVMLITDPKRVKVVDTKNQFSCGERTMDMANRVGAIAAINGSGFVDGPNYDSNGGTPAGIIIEDGRLVNPRKADNSIVYNIIGFNSDGVFVLQHQTSQWALDNNIVSAVSFNPFLVINGKGILKDGESGGWAIAPRTALGQRSTGEVIFLVIDGRQADTFGCDLDVLQKVLLDEKCINGAMMDGGSSTVMCYRGEWVNSPSLGEERWINNCWCVMPIEE